MQTVRTCRLQVWWWSTLSFILNSQYYMTNNYVKSNCTSLSDSWDMVSCIKVSKKQTQRTLLYSAYSSIIIAVSIDNQNQLYKLHIVDYLNSIVVWNLKVFVFFKKSLQFEHVVESCLCWLVVRAFLRSCVLGDGVPEYTAFFVKGVQELNRQVLICFSKWQQNLETKCWLYWKYY